MPKTTTTNKLDFINLYKLPAVQRLAGASQYVYPHMSLTRVSVPFRCAVLGASGSQKTVTALNMILRHFACFSTIVLVAKQLDEPLYRYLCTHHREYGVKRVYSTDNLDDLEELQARASQHSGQKLCLFDDLLTDSKRLPDSCLEIFQRGRKSGWSAMFISSSWTEIDIRVRNCIDLVVLKRLNSDDQVRAILRQFSLGPDAVSLYHEVVQDPADSFLIDKATTDPRLRYRKNYTPIRVPSEMQADNPQVSPQVSPQVKGQSKAAWIPPPNQPLLT